MPEQCTSCETPIPSGAADCPTCGTPVPTGVISTAETKDE